MQRAYRLSLDFTHSLTSISGQHLQRESKNKDLSWRREIVYNCNKLNSIPLALMCTRHRVLRGSLFGGVLVRDKSHAL